MAPELYYIDCDGDLGISLTGGLAGGISNVSTQGLVHAYTSCTFKRINCIILEGFILLREITHKGGRSLTSPKHG